MTTRWIIAVRNENDDLTWGFYGLYGSQESAQRKADAINKRLTLLDAQIAYAYVAPLKGANVPAGWAALDATAA